jgi:hypothetical protein
MMVSEETLTVEEETLTVTTSSSVQVPELPVTV